MLQCDECTDVNMYCTCVLVHHEIRCVALRQILYLCAPLSEAPSTRAQ